jgi:hypothetical protein
MASASVANSSALNPGTVTIPDPAAFSAVYAISDVHGMYGKLTQLLLENGLIDESGHWTGGRALLVVVGDSIDKGPQSIDVIDTWMRLQPEAQAVGGRVVVLLGNHEAEFLHDPTPDNQKADDLFKELKKRGMRPDELTDVKYPRARFLHSLPIAARVGNWAFCHSGFLPKENWEELTAKASELLSGGKYGKDFITGDDSILEAKDWWKRGSKERDKLEARMNRDGMSGAVFGHQPKALGIDYKIGKSRGGRLIKIDNGMAPEAGAHDGSLLIFTKPSELAAEPGARLPQSYALVGGSRASLPIEN